MSIEAITYVKQLDVANPTSRLLLMVIGENTFNDSLVCRVGQAVLSDETRVPTRTIRDHLRRLRRDGVITIQRSKDANGQMQPAAIALVGFGDFLASIRQRRKVVSTEPEPQVAPQGSDTPSQRRTAAGAYKESRTSKTVQDSPPSPPSETSVGVRAQVEQVGDKAGETGGHPVDETGTAMSTIVLPIERAAWLAALRADSIAPDVVEGMIAPLLAVLTVPPKVAPVAWLRIWRDAVAAHAPNAAVRAKARSLIAIERVRDLPWPKDLAGVLARAEAALQVSLPAGDPRWRAWLDHDLRDPSKAAFARAVERNGWPYQADGDWPPGHAQTTGGTE